MDREIIFEASPDFPLNGTLTLPDDGEEPWPAALIVSAYGAYDKDGTIGSRGCNKPYRDIAEALAKRGIAVFRYTKRSWLYAAVLAQSYGVSAWEEVMIDAIGASELLRMRPEIDSGRIFLIGHDFGGMIAPRIDVEGGNFKGLVLLAGSPRLFEEVLLSQVRRTMGAQQGPVMKFLASREARNMYAALKTIPLLDEEESKSTTAFGGSTAWFFKEMARNPASDYLIESGKPVLILQGGKDFQVTVEDDFDVYIELLAGKTNASFKLYPDLNHFFMESKSGDIRKYKAEYNNPGHVAEEVTNDIADWILEIKGSIDEKH